MLKVLGLALTTGLLLAVTSCTNTNTNTNANAARTAATDKATPTPATPTLTPTAPMVASVKNDGLKWRDDVSGSPVTTIKVGGTVTWTISGPIPQSLEKVTADNGCEELEDSFNSDLNPDVPVSKTFTKVGIFGYHCGVHKGNPNCKVPPGSGRMPGIIKVVP